MVIALIPQLGLLDVIGQRAVPGSAQSPAASVLINSPAHVRSGHEHPEMVSPDHR